MKGLKLEFIFHQFWEDQGGGDLGQEYNALAIYRLNAHVGFLWKFAYYNAATNSALVATPNSRTRSILQTTLKF